MSARLWGPAFGLSLICGWLSAGPPTDRPDDDLICTGGGEAPIDVSFEVMATDQREEGESLVVHAEVHNHFEAPAEVLVAHELVDDRGRAQRPLEQLSLGSLDADEARVLELSSPHELRSGFYELRVTAAGMDPRTREQSIAIRSLFFEVGAAGTLPITHDEFMMRSGATLAIHDPNTEELD